MKRIVSGLLTFVFLFSIFTMQNVIVRGEGASATAPVVIIDNDFKDGKVGEVPKGWTLVWC